MWTQKEKIFFIYCYKCLKEEKKLKKKCYKPNMIN